ncbi:MAG: SLC13 family permease, partial [Acidobacteriota bacterium]
LIPLSFASILGGTCTLVGTSTNILASGVLQEAGREPIGMFETAAVGLPLLATGMIYLLVVGDRLLPERETLTSLLGTAERKEFLVEAFVKDDSPLVGQRLGATSLIGGRDIRVIEVVRDNVAQRDAASTVLQVGDRLILGCRPAGVAHARSIEGLGIAATEGLEAISAHEGMIVEGIIGPNSSVVGQTVRQINFRQRFRMVLMALHRRGENLRETIDSIPLQAGDLLLMMGTDRAVQRLRDDDEILLLDYPPIPSRSRRRRAPLVIGVLIAVIVVSALDWLPISGAALIGAVVVLWAGVLTPTEGYASIEWSILMLIFGMLGLGLAMETSGAADLLARGLVAIADWSAIPRDLRLFVALATLYLLTSVLTETLSNNATVVLMTPVAIRLGLALSVDPRPFVIAACIASSASFSTPIGYQTNTYVYGVGGYRFSDFMRVGLPLNLLCFVVTLLVVPRVWSF